MSNKTFDPYLWKLEDLFKGMYNVPVYQRPYSWDKEQVEVLLDDIMEAYNSDSKYEGYYTGNIIIHDKNEKIDGLIQKYDIIDGQQRITTFALILMSAYACLASKKVDANDRTVIAIKSALWKELHRKHNKDYRAVTLNSIEKKCFGDLYDACFINPENTKDFCMTYTCNSKFEKRVVNNYIYIYNRLLEMDTDDLLNFSDYLLRYIQFIVIEANCSATKVFSMFESINSKGKRLENIDLIKTYIFSKIEEDAHDVYLDKWGKLIVSTNDNLYDYLYNYIKAFLKYYRNSINVDNFKSICRWELLNYFGVDNECDALKKLLDDMERKVSFYKMLNSVEDAYGFIKNNKFRFYFKAFNMLAYQHPKALFLRTLIDYNEQKISKEDVIDIISYTVSFMIQVLSIGNRDSKDVISMFSNIMNNAYENKSLSKDDVLQQIASELHKQGVKKEKVEYDIKVMDAFNNKWLSAILLSMYESTYSSSGTIKVSYDQAYAILHSYKDVYSLDHLLVQTPNKDSIEFKYYKSDDDTLVLKPENDFPKEFFTGMDYNIFLHDVLNKIGNLRIYCRDKNSSKSNSAIQLPEYNDFNTYSKIKERESNIADVLVNICLLRPKVDITQLKTPSKTKETADFPNMRELIDNKLVNVGDKLYIVGHDTDSEAILLDDKYVNYKGKKLTLNEWGCVVTGWKSIRIYSYAAICGEKEVLHDKRLKLSGK